MSNYKIYAVLFGIALCLLFPGALLSDQSVMKRGDVTVEKRTAVDDVVVAQGDLMVKGRVKGSIFLVNGNILLNSGSVVEGNITLLDGSLWVLPGSQVKGEISVLAGKLHIEDGAKVASEARSLEKVPTLPAEKISIVSRYLVFNRFVPPSPYDFAKLSLLDLGQLRLRKKADRIPEELKFFYKMGKMPINSEDVADSRELIFKKHDIWVRVVAIRFNSQPSTENFWDGLQENFEEKARHSVHNSLGEGAHWFFRYEGSSYCLWQKGDVFQAVMIRHDDDHPERREWAEVESLRDAIILELEKFYSSVEEPISE